jgi:hypothetical protein
VVGCLLGIFSWQFHLLSLPWVHLHSQLQPLWLYILSPCLKPDGRKKYFWKDNFIIVKWTTDMQNFCYNKHTHTHSHTWTDRILKNYNSIKWPSFLQTWKKKIINILYENEKIPTWGPAAW